MVVSFVFVNGHAAGVVDGWFLAAPVGLSFDEEFVGGGGKPVDGGLGEQGSAMMASHSSAVRLEVTTVEVRWWRSMQSW